MCFTDQGIADGRTLVDDECRWIRSLTLRVPTQSVSAGEDIIWINEQFEVARNVLVPAELFRVLLQFFRRTGINQDDTCPGCFNFFCMSEKVTYLPCAKWTLIPWPTAQHDQDNGSIFQFFGKLHRNPIERVQRKIRGLVTHRRHYRITNNRVRPRDRRP